MPCNSETFWPSSVFQRLPRAVVSMALWLPIPSLSPKLVSMGWQKAIYESQARSCSYGKTRPGPGRSTMRRGRL